MKQGEYLVTGERNYRGVEPGKTFIARLDRGAERRALARGNIKLLGRIEPRIEPGLLTFPDGWLDQPPSRKRGAGRRLSHSRR